MLKTDNIGTGQPGPSSPLAPSPPLPLKEDRKETKPQQFPNMKISLLVIHSPYLFMPTDKRDINCQVCNPIN